jgi:hypothetical protein
MTASRTDQAIARSLKSYCATVAFSAFLFGHNLNAQIICAGYGQGLANTFRSNEHSDRGQGVGHTALSGTQARWRLRSHAL